MKAVVQSGYGAAREVLSVADMPTPEIQDDQVLVKVLATSVHADIWHVMRGYPKVFRYLGIGRKGPKRPVPGTDLSGEVVAVGAQVSEFKVGDAVFGEVINGMQWQNGGAFAQYAPVSPSTLVHKPPNVSFAEAACVPTSGYIVTINLPPLTSGSRVLINGAGGSVGTLALQLAKAKGAQVTAVDENNKLALLTLLGADQVVDYKKENVYDLGPFDLIFDVASNLNFGRCKTLLADGGKYVIIGHDHYGQKGSPWFGNLPHFFRLMLQSIFDRHLPKITTKMPSQKSSLETLKTLMDEGKVTPVVGKTFSLEEIHSAMDMLIEGQSHGKIILLPNGPRVGQNTDQD